MDDNRRFRVALMRFVDELSIDPHENAEMRRSGAHSRGMIDLLGNVPFYTADPRADFLQLLCRMSRRVYYSVAPGVSPKLICAHRDTHRRVFGEVLFHHDDVVRALYARNVPDHICIRIFDLYTLM